MRSWPLCLPMRLALCSVCLSACSPSGQDGLSAWVQAERAATPPQLEPWQAPAGFLPQDYAGAGLLDPFSPDKLARATPGAQPEPAAHSVLPARESKRSKQPLEAFPLDSMALVGTLDSQGQRVALIRVQQLLHQVRTGAYLGQQHGRVVRITERAVELRETVQNASGEWVERVTTLPIEKEAPP